ncbi:unnamed protein product, partial [Mesorhabditis belari]|uniref:DUF5648 domain-containing protein n=1 Tax=Mesorhabditis belari TaxID=2138241 RepID=A0AAF3F3B1_9BILA
MLSTLLLLSLLATARTAPQTGPIEQIDCQRDSVKSCSCKSGAALTPLRRSWNGELQDHFYTLNRDEQLNYVGLGYKVESDMGFIATATPGDCAGIVPIYRMSHVESHDHFYTTSYIEMLNYLRNYYIESTAIGYCMSGPGCGLIPLHRLTNWTIVDHLYTIDDAEKDRAMQGQYDYNGIQCYVWSSLDATDC